MDCSYLPLIFVGTIVSAPNIKSNWGWAIMLSVMLFVCAILPLTFFCDARKDSLLTSTTTGALLAPPQLGFAFARDNVRS